MMAHTEDDDIKYQNNESNNPTTWAIFPCITMSSNLNRLSKRQSEEEELKEKTECILEHVDWFWLSFVLCFLLLENGFQS